MAAAVAGLLAVGGVAQAEEILVDYDYVTQDQGTTKFISGNGNTLNIQTSANAQQMINEIKEALKADSTSEKLSGILGAIGTNNENMTAILTGTIDNTTNNIFGLVDLVESFDPSLSEDPKYGKLFQYAEKLDKQF